MKKSGIKNNYYEKPKIKTHGNLKELTKDKGGLGGDASGQAS